MWRTAALIAIFLLIVVSFITYKEHNNYELKATEFRRKYLQMEQELQRTREERVVLGDKLDSLNTTYQSVVRSDSLKSTEIRSLKTKYKNYSNKSTQEIEKEMIQRWQQKSEK